MRARHLAMGVVVGGLALAAVAPACDADPVAPPGPSAASASAPAIGPTAPAPGPIARMHPWIMEWAADPAVSAFTRSAAESLLAGTCPTRAGDRMPVRLRGRLGANGEVEWMGDDALPGELARCFWDPFERRRAQAAGDFYVLVSLADNAATLSAPVDIGARGDWSGLSCRQRSRSECPSGQTCPAYVWARRPCP